MNIETPSHLALRSLLNFSSGLLSHEREIKKVTGGNFNLFQTLGVSHYEMAHSALIAELLNPKGTHGQGSLFLKLLLNSLAITNVRGFPAHFDVDRATVRTEVYIGPKTQTTGGRLDIEISDHNGNKIIIENKIYAEEQENQIKRYSAHGFLIYLTLFEVDLSKIRNKDDRRVQFITYEQSIRDWLIECRKEAATLPLLRESITQYLNLILLLTHQNSNSRMNTQLTDEVLSNPEFFEAFIAIRNADHAIRSKILREFINRISEKCPDDFKPTGLLGCEFKAQDGFAFHTGSLKQLNLIAVIAFDGSNYNGCYFGIRKYASDQSAPDALIVLECFKNAFSSIKSNCQANKSWLAYSNWSRHPNWDDSVFRMMHFDQARFDDEFLMIVNGLKEVSNAIVQAVGARLKPSCSPCEATDDIDPLP